MQTGPAQAGRSCFLKQSGNRTSTPLMWLGWASCRRVGVQGKRYGEGVVSAALMMLELKRLVAKRADGAFEARG